MRFLIHFFERLFTGFAVLALMMGPLFGGCASRTEVFHTDLTQQTGVYVVGYTRDPAVRARIEDQLVRDLAARQITAWTSHPEIPDLTRGSAADVVAAANRHDAVGVIVINQVAADGADAVVENPQRITPLHPDLQTFISQSRAQMSAGVAAGQTVFAEVNLFLVDGNATRLFWSGTTWSFNADGKGTAARGISETIADQLVDARAEFERGPFQD